ncbi:hypothetical protein ABE10_00410, partial [Bacillus toyonensis]|nr:hypothetical protein [Bacillus toyonensis]
LVARGARGLAGPGGEDALRHRRDRGRPLLHADAAEQDREDHDREQQVHERAAEHDDDPLPHRQPIEDPLLTIRVDRVVVRRARVLDERTEDASRGFSVRGRRRVHPRHRDEAADRQRLDPVLRLADTSRPQPWPEPDHVLADVHAEQLRRHEMADLVQGDRDAQADQHEQQAADVQQDFHPATLPARTRKPPCYSDATAMSRSAVRRAHRSASKSVSTVRVSGGSCASTTRAIVSTIPRNGSRPSWKASTACSFAALYTAGKVRPARPTAFASATEGNATSSSGSNVQVLAERQSRGV